MMSSVIATCFCVTLIFCVLEIHFCRTVCVGEGLAMEKDGRSSAMSEGEVLDEEDDDGDDDEEGGAETEDQSCTKICLNLKSIKH